jgi:transposase
VVVGLRLHTAIIPAQYVKPFGHNKATVALANKLARICWAVWKHNTDFNAEHLGA